MGDMLAPDLSWKDVEWLRKIWDRPFLLKGILHPEEARRAMSLGVDGIIVSNHGGRQLDMVPSSLEALPEVLDAVNGRAPVLIDGGVRRGSHVVKALALGATACLIGRPQLWGLAAAGEHGVSWVLELLRREIDRTLGLGGWDCIADVDQSALFVADAELTKARTICDLSGENTHLALKFASTRAPWRPITLLRGRHRSPSVCKPANIQHHEAATRTKQHRP